MYTFGCPRAPPPKNNNKSCINIVVQIYSWVKLYSFLFLRILMYYNEFENNNNDNVIKKLNQRKNWTIRYTLNSVTQLVHSLKTCFCFKHRLESETMPEHLLILFIFIFLFVSIREFGILYEGIMMFQYNFYNLYFHDLTL